MFAHIQLPNAASSCSDCSLPDSKAKLRPAVEVFDEAEGYQLSDHTPPS